MNSIVLPDSVDDVVDGVTFGARGVEAARNRCPRSFTDGDLPTLC